MDGGALYRTESAALRRYLARMSGDTDAAEDLVHETFVRALRHPAALKRSGRGWLFTVATNLLRDRARARERHTRLATEIAEPVAPRTDADAEAGELRERLHAALAALSHRERSAILLRHEGYAQREIAEILGTTTGTIGTLTARALRKLADSEPLRPFRP
ncbi:MAG: sigma-70 family RNA polymerase sigma factor [Gemmatimonadota bacterium]